MKQQMAAANIDDKLIRQQEAIISSMTRKERKNVNLLNASRRRRIAAGSGTSVQLVNRLIKHYQDMSRMMKQVQKLGKSGLMRTGLQGLFGGGTGPGPGIGGGGLGGPFGPGGGRH
ncbi:MAG: signal recognition particle protein, partial [Alphaproteobacteria bacterium]|nr:signal recognition particle protein [Alphaproteobacteria bacterium]